MIRNPEESKIQTVLRRIEGGELKGRFGRLPGWAVAAILGAGFSLAACDSKDPCEEDCNNITPNVNNIYGNINNYNNSYYNINNYNNPLYGIQDAGSDTLDADAFDGAPGNPDAESDASPRPDRK